MKDCTFQYATGNGEVFEDTDLITKAEAEQLWDKYLPMFIKHKVDGMEPEMVIWTDMVSDTDYHTDEMHLYESNCIVKDGQLYQLIG